MCGELYEDAVQHRKVNWRKVLGFMCPRISAFMKITLCDSDPVVLVTSSCSCVAGIGLCDHLVALLYQTAHYSECGMSAVPPVLSCTETEQKWHKPRTMGVKPGPVDPMVVVKPKPGATSSSGVRSALYKGYRGELDVTATLNPTAVYTDFDPDSLPLICSVNISPDKPLVDSIFGKVQAGSILSYQHPPPTSDCVITHMDAPLFPKVPLEDYHLKPTDCKYVPTEQEQLHLQSLSVTKSQSHNIEEFTRNQSAAPEWHSLRKERVTASTFREVSHVRGASTAENLAERIIRGTRQTALMKRGLDLEMDALKD
ncbi:transcript variant X1 [Nothobranchius furzeri]|uniref:Transcript variant X1 n=1 Tax=Nothobranchius furzeri TaxID=105023 RepID=A0A9D3C2W6_NOTFU|nr:transcript variant X1 [Nothobranchius furzeri]